MPSLISVYAVRASRDPKFRKVFNKEMKKKEKVLWGYIGLMLGFILGALLAHGGF